MTGPSRSGGGHTGIDADRVSRRAFLALSGAGVLTLYVSSAAGVRKVAAAPIPGGTLAPGASEVREAAGDPSADADRLAEHLRDRGAAVLAGDPAGRAAADDGVELRRGGRSAATFNYPAFTIEATRGTPTTVTWINDLADGAGGSCRTCCRSTRPCTGPTRRAVSRVETRDRRSPTTPGPYTGPVPIVTHVHGMEDVPTTGATATPRPGSCRMPSDIPAGYATVGTWYDFFADKAGAPATDGARAG